MTTTQTNPARTVPVTMAKLGSRQFIAGCAFKTAPEGIAKGNIRGTRKTALRSMEETLRALGYQGPFPAWDVRDAATAPVGTTPAPEPEVEEAPATERMPTMSLSPDDPSWSRLPYHHARLARQMPHFEDRIPTGDESEHVADVAEEAVQRALEAAPLIPSPAANMRPGKFSPLNGLDFWVDVYLDTVARFVDIEFPGETPADKVRNFRESVDLVMRDPKRNCVGAWDRDPSGTPWIIRAQAMRPDVVFDPTRRAIRRTGRKVYDKVRTFAGNATRVAEHGPVYAPGHKPEPKQVPVELSPAAQEVFTEIAQVRAGLNKPAAKPEATPAPAASTVEGNVVARAQHEGVTYLKLDSGRWVKEGTNIKPERVVRRVLNQALMAAKAPAPKAPAFKPETAADKVAYRSAYVWASRLSAAAKAKGEDQRTAYKVGMVAAMRAQGATHPKFEAELRALGATDAYLAAQTEAALEWLTNPAAKAA